MHAHTNTLFMNIAINTELIDNIWNTHMCDSLWLLVLHIYCRVDINMYV